MAKDSNLDPNGAAGAAATFAAAEQARKKTQALLTDSFALRAVLDSTLQQCRNDSVSGRTHDLKGLHSEVRIRLLEAALPLPMRITWSGIGSGTPCNVCGSAIHPPDSEYDVTTNSGRRMVAHFICYVIWREESKADQALDSPDVEGPPRPPS